MNKYFGKTSQKLIIAGIVVCACAAQVFRIEAVQDFFLYDVAQALIGRPLTRPHVYRAFLSGLSVFIPAAAFIVFGFLYSMATFPKVSGYFKDTARELKDFFHERNVFNRRNGYIFLAVFAVTFIGYFALIRGDSGYRDDLYRQNSGTFGWLARYGRVITETVNLAIHGAYSIHDRSPLGQIIAMGVLSVAALVMALAFSGFLVMGGQTAKLAQHCRRHDRRVQPLLSFLLRLQVRQPCDGFKHSFSACAIPICPCGAALHG